MKFNTNFHLDELLASTGLTMHGLTEIVEEYSSKYHVDRVSRKFITQLAQNKNVPAFDKVDTIINALCDKGYSVTPHDIVTFDSAERTSIKLLALQKSTDEKQTDVYTAFVKLSQHSKGKNKSSVGLLDFTVKEDPSNEWTFYFKPYTDKQLVEPVQSAAFGASFNLIDIQNAIYSLAPTDLRTTWQSLIKQIYVIIEANHYEQMGKINKLTININSDFKITFNAVTIKDHQLIFAKNKNDVNKRSPQYQIPFMRPTQVGKMV